MITTAGNGPAPSGFTSSIGICSEVPLEVVVAIDGPESVEAQPATATLSASAATVSRSLIAPIVCRRGARVVSRAGVLNARARRGSAAGLEVLDRALVRFGLASRSKCPQITALSRLRILLARIESISSGAEPSNHRCSPSRARPSPRARVRLSYFHSYQRRAPPSTRRHPGRAAAASTATWEYPREIWSADQMDSVEVMELNDAGLIQPHRACWGWRSGEVIRTDADRRSASS